MILGSFTLREDFLNEQKKFERVRTAIKEKEQIISQKLKGYDLKLDSLNILIIAYKDNDDLEIYGKNRSDKEYIKLETYKICSRSGELGPKRRQGDNQVPEGFYHIERFNPTSNYYLSLGLNYPNQADKKKSKSFDLGGDIYIHGSCVTIGCMPMTDDKIKEIYLYAINAKNNGQDLIPVYIFPFKMTNQNFKTYLTRFKNNRELIDFWSNIKTGYDKFFLDNNELIYTIDSKGNYKY